MKRIITVLAAAASLMLAGAIPATATTTGLCWVSPDQKARLSVSRYAVSGGVEYHMDLNSSTGALTPKYYQLSITFDGAGVSGTNDVYRKVSGGTHTITGHWSGVTSSCTVRL